LKAPLDDVLARDSDREGEEPYDSNGIEPADWHKLAKLKAVVSSPEYLGAS
jgi:hypothetical protein